MALFGVYFEIGRSFELNPDRILLVCSVLAKIDCILAVAVVAAAVVVVVGAVLVK